MAFVLSDATEFIVEVEIEKGRTQESKGTMLFMFDATPTQKKKRLIRLQASQVDTQCVEQGSRRKSLT